MDPVVIVGAGLAGYTLARELRRRDPDIALVVVSADDAAFYSKPMLSNALAGGRTPAQLATHSAAQMAAQLGARVLADTVVTAIDRAGRRLATSAGPIAYDRLVLATGARPIRPPFAGDGAGEALSVNNLADYTRFRQRIDGAGEVAIIGAGLIGCEFADDLRRGGHAVTVFDLAPQPLGRLAPPALAARLRERLAAAGVAWRLGAGIERIERDAAGLRIIAGATPALRAEVVLCAVGLQPDTGLARAAGLEVGRGIRVDAELRSSDPHIYALGDCAEVAGRVEPFVLPIMHGARALAATLAGRPTALVYPPMPVVVKTPSCPTVVCPPPPGAAGSWTETVSADAVRALFCDAAGLIRGFALAGTAAGERQALAARLGQPAARPAELARHGPLTRG